MPFIATSHRVVADASPGTNSACSLERSGNTIEVSPPPRHGQYGRVELSPSLFRHEHASQALQEPARASGGHTAAYVEGVVAGDCRYRSMRHVRPGVSIHAKRMCPSPSGASGQRLKMTNDGINEQRISMMSECGMTTIGEPSYHVKWEMGMVRGDHRSTGQQRGNGNYNASTIC